jgi:tripartite-type tricarboxylate transporter receptor subunit TctC
MAKFTRRAIVVGALAMPAIARAQTWPSSKITLVVPYTAGGSNDVIARLAQPMLQERLGVPVLIENRPGGGTAIGAALVAKAPRDGSHWLINADPQALSRSLLATMPYGPDELEPLMLIGTSPNVLATSSDKPYRTLEDLLAPARNSSRDIVFGVISETIGHMAMLMLGKRAGVKFTPVGYRGGAQVVNDALGGHVEVVAGSAALMIPHVNGGKLRAIAQMGATRNSLLANVPTVAESGFPGFSAVSFWGWFATAGTPQPVLRRFEEVMRTALGQEDVRAKLTGPQVMDVKLTGPDEFRPFFDDQVKVWAQVIEENGLKSKG